MWKSKLLKQTGICIVMVLAFLTARNTGVPLLQQGSEAATALLSQNYTVQDAITAARKGIEVAARAPAAVTNTIKTAAEKREYADPIDDDITDGETVSVHAAGEGTVISTGENDKIGKFIKISHQDGSESIYGNCETVYVKELDHVKKGQTIAAFHKEPGLEFYYFFSQSEEKKP